MESANRFMKHISISLLLVCASIGACSKWIPTSASAREAADRRFVAHAKALGIDASSIPEPRAEERAGDFLFVYRRAGKTITVVIGKDGSVSDGATL